MKKKSFGTSEALLRRALKVTPVGAQTFSKSHRYLSGSARPCFIDKGKGARVWDVDGNEFIDFILGLGPITVGYNDPEVNAAITAQLAKGITFSQSTALEVELAEKLAEIIPSAEMARFVKNGGDATSAAIRLARAGTGRDMVAVCGYHGMHDWYVGATPLNAGVPESVKALTKTFEYNKIDTLDKLFAQYPNQIAAVILEPCQGDGPENGFLEAVRASCEKHGAVLIFDEVVSGFRVALGGAQEYYEVTPDMTTIGKGMANGMPISAVVGKRELLDQINDGVFISTTFGGECLSLAAALKTIEILSRPDAFDKIWRVSSKLRDGAVELAATKGLADIAKMWGLPPHAGFMFSETDALSPTDLLSVFQQRLLLEGILSLGINNFCLAHDEKDVDIHLAAIDKALNDVAKALDANSIDSILQGPPINPIFKRN